VQVQLTSNTQKGPKADQMRQTAAMRIAEAFADLRAQGHSAGDMALLLGGMTNADVYARALRDCGLPCVITGGSVFARAPEAALVLNLARIVANPYRTQSLHNVLTSPLFELSAGDLLFLTTTVDQADSSLKRENLCSGLMSAVRLLKESGPLDAWSARLVLALRVMGELLEGSARTTTSRLVMRVLADSGWLSRMQKRGPEGLASVANAYKTVRMIEEIEESTAAGPAKVASQLEALFAEAKEAPGALSTTDGDFVRIMTVHASKGLEFPIVAVAELKESGGPSSKLLASSLDGAIYLSLDLGNSATALDGSAKLKDMSELYAAMTEDLVDEDELACAIKRADGPLALRAALYEYERVGDAEESKRLLYVALTRAKEALVISLTGKRTKENPLATPKSCLGAVVDALAGTDGGFCEGVSHYEYGGSQAALVEHVALVSDEADEADEGKGVDVDAPCVFSEGEFAIPAPEERPAVSRTPYAPAHEGIFSYSSISDASHQTDVLQRLAEKHFEGADEPEAQQLFSLSLVSKDDAEDLYDFIPGWHEADLGAATADEDDGSWAYRKVSSADSDKATDLGTAFHRLAQYAVVARGSFGFARPSTGRVSALSRACKLDDTQIGRLNEALDRWFASDIALMMQDLDDLRAEVPFFLRVPVDGKDEPVFLEGEIDLLGLSDEGAHAIVVDYKTGGRDDEGPDELAEKHVLQAACYAYAVMSQGVKSVEAVFVRVERPRADGSGQPQCVRYRFESGDIAELEQAIADAYAAQ
jgi:ATP-dependent exoDNAse (exonuclease V) beta subunit